MENRKANEEVKMQSFLGKEVLEAYERNCKGKKCQESSEGVTQDRPADTDTGLHWEGQSLTCFLSINPSRGWHLLMRLLSDGR